MRLSLPIYVLKRQAKAMARKREIPLHAALDRVAAESGYQGWSHLVRSTELKPAEQILLDLRPGDMLLIGARPGQGKTSLGLELASSAAQIGRKGFFFTLDYSESNVQRQLELLNPGFRYGEGAPLIDTSDDICADYIIERLTRDGRNVLAVVDYLQLLDQDRTKPALGVQVQALKAYAEASGALIVAISQIDRTFDEVRKELPGLADVRIPNPVELHLFNRTCFIHEGEANFL